jgi:hypothetical protein
MSPGWEVDDRIRGSSISTLELSGATARLSHQPFTHTFTELVQTYPNRSLTWLYNACWRFPGPSAPPKGPVGCPYGSTVSASRGPEGFQD